MPYNVHITEHERPKIVLLREQGYNVSETAAELGVSNYFAGEMLYSKPQFSRCGDDWGRFPTVVVFRLRSVETTAQQGGIELDPYYCLVEDGRPGWLFQEIRDLFYYIQILCQGTFSPARREVKDYIPIDSLPDLMRALGFFPSEYEVENLIVEAKYKVYLKAPVSEIGFEEFVQLYLNHRPVFGESFKRLRTAFRTFAYVLASKPDEFFMKREDFIDMLSNNGEYFSRELCWYLLTILSGHSFEDRALMSEDDFSFLPEFINFNHFVTEIIGINELDDVSVPSGADSMVSSYTQISVDSDD